MLSPRMLARNSVKQPKEQERRFIDILKQQIADFPSGRLAETESPDFVVTTSNGKIGIEVTKIHRQATSNRLKREESEQEKIANEAVRIFETKNSVALEVKIHFSADNEFNKRNRRRLATAIASLVNAYAPTEDGPCVLQNNWTNPETFPYEIDSIGILSTSEFEAQLLVSCVGRLCSRRFCRGNASRDC